MGKLYLTFQVPDELQSYSPASLVFQQWHNGQTVTVVVQTSQMLGMYQNEHLFQFYAPAKNQKQKHLALTTILNP